MTARLGSLCSGYGGLDMAVAEVFGAETVWVSDIDKGANKILAHRYPDVPNLGDFTKADWSTVEPIDILTAGYPCQPFSHAGQRKGTDDDRHLWPAVREAIRRVRPRLTVLENVAGHRSLGFDRVLGDLAEDGLHVQWTSLRASDVGAPHQRERLFVAVTPDPQRFGRDGWSRKPIGRPQPRTAAAWSPASPLLPTPAVNDMGVGKSVEAWDEWPAEMQAKHANGNGHGNGKSLAIELQRVESGWGPYSAAIARWEPIVGRPAPPPSEPTLVREWMMGLPAGWVTDVPGIARNEVLKALGNGVVPQQATAALRLMASWEVAA